MSEEQNLTGVRLVDRVLIDPLEADGMKRHPRTSVESHQAFLKKLRSRLAYLSAANLAALRPILRSHAGGKARNIWPGFVTIENAARTLQVPPFDEDRLFLSWMKSIEGEKLLSGGGMVETMRYLRKMKRPPVGEYVKTKIMEEAAENARRLDRIRRQIEQGEARQSDLEFMNWYNEGREKCVAVIEEGIRARAEKAAA